MHYGVGVLPARPYKPRDKAPLEVGVRVVSHRRHHGRGHTVTNPDDGPKSHLAHLEWTPSRMGNWARTIGPQTARVFERIPEAKPHPEMGWGSWLGLIRLGATHSPARLEAATEQALRHHACRYQSIKSILKNSLDRQPLEEAESSPPATPPEHDNLRGAGYFEGERA